MKRLAALVLVAAAVAGCSQTDDERTDITEIEGVRCAVVRDGLNRIRGLSCDWESER